MYLKTLLTKPRGWLTALAVLAASQYATEAGLTQFDISYHTTYTGVVHSAAGAENVYLTAFKATRIGGDPLPASHADPFTTFCLDIRYNLSDQAYWGSGSFPSGSNGGVGTPNWTTDGIYRAASLYKGYASSVNDTATGILNGAALQIAIWEVLYETENGPYSVTSGTGFRVDANGGNSAVLAAANSMLASAWNVVDSSITTTFWNATLDKNGSPLAGNQDLIGPFAPAPEPTSFLAASLLLVPFLANAVRRKRKNLLV